MFFISCDVQPEDFGQVVRCPNFSGGNAQIFTQEEIEQMFTTTITVDGSGVSGTSSCDPSIDEGCVSGSDLISVLVYSFCLLAFCLGFFSGKQR